MKKIINNSNFNLQKILKIYSILILIVSITLNVSFADNEVVDSLGFSIQGAIGVWNHDPGGLINYNGDNINISDDLALSNCNDFQIWFGIEHPVPFFPDIKLQYNPIRFSEDTNTQKTLKFGQTDYESIFNSEVDLDILDITLYKHIPALKLLTAKAVDITYGTTIRYLNGKAAINGIDLNNTNIRTLRNFDNPMILLYAGVNISPIDKFSLLSEVRGMAYSGNHWYDIMAEIKILPLNKYTFIGLGYRYQDMELDDVSDVTACQRIQGLFLETGFTF